MTVKSLEKVRASWSTDFRWLRWKNNEPRCCYCIKWRTSSIVKAALYNHANSQGHKKNLSAAKGLPAPGLAAPSVEEFKECIQRRLDGVSFRKSPVGSEKDMRLAWCLNEAILDRQRKMLRNGKVISSSITQDAQGQLLSVRFFSSVRSALVSKVKTQTFDEMFN